MPRAAATEDFTTDKARLLAAIDRFNASRLASATVERDKEARAGTVLHGGKDPDDFERARRARALAEVLRVLAVNVEKSGPRRKTLLLFSKGRGVRELRARPPSARRQDRPG